MADKKQTIQLFLKKVTVLCLYALLFIAHLLPDFFISKINNSAHPLQLKQSSVSNHLSFAHLKQTNKDTAQKPTIRLNKRFQPETGIIPINTYTLSVPDERYTDLTKIGQPTEYLLFALILAQSLRGPPVVA